jgi:hypothetical protein
MEPAMENRRTRAISLLLAGLQAGMVGVCWMLAWLGVSAVWQRRSFWTAENLMASAFYGDRAIRSGFAERTLSGLALYLLLYSLLGALFAWAAGNRLPRVRVLLVALIFSLTWYYVSFRLLFKSVIPLVALLHAERSTMLGHLVYGTFLARYPVYLPPATAPPAEAPSPEAPVETPAVESEAHPPDAGAA